MSIDMPWHLLKTEIGLIVLAVSCVLLDLILPKEKRGALLANIAMVGVTLLFAGLSLEWGNFGTGFLGSYVQDGLSLFMKSLVLLAAFFTLFMSREYQPYLKRGQGELVLLILFALIGMLFAVSANDFLLLFVALETVSISMYIMTAYLRDHDSSIEAGVKYLVLGSLSTALFLFGISFIYGATGETGFAQIASKISSLETDTAPFGLGVVLVLASLCLKVSVVPFQLWAPDVYQGAPTPVTAYLATASKATGFAALLRLCTTVFQPAMADLSPLFAVLSALTILYGNLGAIPQTNIKRLLGYSSIGHAGYIFMGLAAFGHSGNEAILFYLTAYIFSTAGAFLALMGASSLLKNEDIRELAGLSKKSPVLAGGFLVALMSLAGVPPLAGFFAKYYVLWTSVKAGYVWLAALGAVNVVTSLYYYLKVVKVIYVDEPQSPEPLRVSLDRKMFQYFAMFGAVFLGIFQGPVVRLAADAFRHFIR